MPWTLFAQILTIVIVVAILIAFVIDYAYTSRTDNRIREREV